MTQFEKGQSKALATMLVHARFMVQCAASVQDEEPESEQLRECAVALQKAILCLESLNAGRT